MILRELFGLSNQTKPATQPPKGAPVTAPVIPKIAVSEPQAFNPAQHKETLISLAKAKGLKSANDLSSFLGQCQVETANWTAASEKFGYTDPQRIYKVFTSKFKTPAEATPYVGNPVALANRALANKNGNGDENSGDGWKYRGRGFIHITGRELYAKVGAAVHPENPNIYIDNPTLLSSNPKEAALASIAYFKIKVGKGKTAKQATKVVNPAGLKSKERLAATQQQKQQLAAAQPKKPGQAATPKPQPTKIASRE
jgi:putative chitinase